MPAEVEELHFQGKNVIANFSANGHEMNLAEIDRVGKGERSSRLSRESPFLKIFFTRSPCAICEVTRSGVRP